MQACRKLTEFLLLDLPERDAARLAELSAKANKGNLSGAEEAALEACVNASDLLAFWQPKARQALA